MIFRQVSKFLRHALDVILKKLQDSIMMSCNGDILQERQTRQKGGFGLGIIRVPFFFYTDLACFFVKYINSLTFHDHVIWDLSLIKQVLPSKFWLGPYIHMFKMEKLLSFLHILCVVNFLNYIKGPYRLGVSSLYYSIFFFWGKWFVLILKVQFCHMYDGSIIPYFSLRPVKLAGLTNLNQNMKVDCMNSRKGICHDDVNAGHVPLPKGCEFEMVLNSPNDDLVLLVTLPVKHIQLRASFTIALSSCEIKILRYLFISCQNSKHIIKMNILASIHL